MDWLLADAKNKLSEVVTLALTEGPQRVRRRNQAVVIMAEADYERLSGKRKGFKDFLMEGPDFTELNLDRSADTMREIEL